jgi:hypothetical protein
VSVLSLALWGCGSAMMPFEPVHASGSAGAMYPTAAYDLKIGAGSLGDAAVWSEGATDEPSASARIVDVEMTIHNATSSPLRLDVTGSRVGVKTHDGRSAELGTAVHRGGSDTVPPGSSSRVGLHFPLPPGIVASDVAEFDFRWRVASSVGDYEQSTWFVPVPPPYTDDVNGLAPTCVGPYGLSASWGCRDAISRLKR